MIIERLITICQLPVKRYSPPLQKALYQGQEFCKAEVCSEPCQTLRCSVLGKLLTAFCCLKFLLAHFRKSGIILLKTNTFCLSQQYFLSFCEDFLWSVYNPTQMFGWVLNTSLFLAKPRLVLIINYQLLLYQKSCSGLGNAERKSGKTMFFTTF